MQLSQHFSLEELTFSQVAARTGIDNTPSDEVVANLTRLCNLLLEPARAMLEVPVHVDSGYRSTVVNAAVGGARDSAHMSGRAADTVFLGIPLEEAFDKLRASDLPFDQIIFECRAWIHLAIAPEGVQPRREALTATGHAGAWHYQPA